MTVSILRIAVRFHEGRFHGSHWPSAPFRLFQALVAGTYGRRNPSSEPDAALQWLERLDAPTIAVPPAIRSRSACLYVPNNDLDTVGGDPRLIAKVRGAEKKFRPWLFDADEALRYGWRFEAGAAHEADAVMRLAQQLHTLGWGVDAAFAIGDVLTPDEWEKELSDHHGPVYRPGPAGEQQLRLRCPAPGSLDALKERHRAFGGRLERSWTGSKNNPKEQTLYRRPPELVYRTVAYASPPRRILYDLRNADGGFFAWPQEQAHGLVVRVRDLLCERLPKHAAALKGAKGNDEAAKASRARFIPLPSIGMEHTDRSIRRLLIELPSGCPLKITEICAKLSGASLDTVDPETGEVLADGPRLIEATDMTTDTMLRHYGIGDGPDHRYAYRRWRSITPLTLPVNRRRIDPDRQREEAKSGSERLTETAAAIAAVKAALRHAGRERAQVVAARPQKEPFSGKGLRAEDFDLPERFSKHRMWHLDLTLRDPISGPLILGDGRFLGLGLMAPVKEPPAILAYAIDASTDDPAALCRALRRAVMHRVAAHLGKRSTHDLKSFFTGHEREGAPLRQGDHRHLFFAVDHTRLLIIAPHLVERRAPGWSEWERLAELDAALIGLDRLALGRRTYRLTPLPEPGDDDPLLRPARLWKSLTAYAPTRHPKRGEDARAHLARDVQAEASRRGLPRPDRDPVVSLEEGPRGGLTDRIELDFAVAVKGPILLGRTAHLGGGLFGGPSGNGKGGD